MKRSRLLGILLLLTATATLAAQEQRALIGSSRMGERFSFEVEVAGAPEAEILDALGEGMRAQVEYRVQLYREARGLWRFFGDRLIEEYETRYVAYLDPFTRAYKIETHGAFRREERSIEEPQAFLDAFLSLHSGQLPLPGGGRGYRIRGRVIVRPVRVAPPLGLMGLFLPNQRYPTGWATTEL